MGGLHYPEERVLARQCDAVRTDTSTNWPCLRALMRHTADLSQVREMYGGEGGIRTHGTVAGTPHFECGAFDLSATSPLEQGHSRGIAGGSWGGPLAAAMRLAKPLQHYPRPPW